MAQPYPIFRVVLFIYSSVGNITLDITKIVFLQHFYAGGYRQLVGAYMHYIHLTGSLSGSMVDNVDEKTAHAYHLSLAAEISTIVTSVVQSRLIIRTERLN